MTSTAPVRVVLDASAAVALLADSGPAGTWVEEAVGGAGLVAPDVLPFEAVNVLRRHVLAGTLDTGVAAQARVDLTALVPELYPYALVADRVWELRDHVTAYDAAYLALAELLALPLVTLDAQLAHVPGVRCPVLCYAPSR